jgi:hypothetical protein
VDRQMKISECRVAHLWVMMVMAFLPLVAWAEEEVPATPVVPRLVEFQGALKDAEGKARPGLFSLTFALYSQPEGGGPVWVETQAVRVGADGRYRVLLGSATSGGVPADALISTSNSVSSNVAEGRWLGIQVEQEEEQTPRVVLVSVPFALKAADSERLGGKSASDFVLIGQLSKVVGPTQVVLGSTAGGAAAGATANNKADAPTTTQNNIVVVPAATKAATSTSGTALSADYIVYTSGSTTYAMNGTTDNIDYSGTDSSAVINAAIAALTYGGTVLIKAGVYQITTKILITNSSITLEGEGPRSVLSLGDIHQDSGIQIGNGSSYIDSVCIRDLLLYDLNGTTTDAIHAIRLYHGSFERLILYLNVGSNTHSGLVLDGGSSGFAGWNVIEGSHISGYQFGIQCVGSSVFGCNANSIVNTHVEGLPSPVPGSIGIDFETGDTNNIFAGDVDHFATGLKLGGNASLSGGYAARFEGNTTDVLFTAGSSHNRLFGGSINTVTTGGVDNLIIQASGYSSYGTYSSLPKCNSAVTGMTKRITDASTSVWGATIAGGGTNNVLAYCDGTNWTVMAK